MITEARFLKILGLGLLLVVASMTLGALCGWVEGKLEERRNKKEMSQNALKI